MLIRKRFTTVFLLVSMFFIGCSAWHPRHSVEYQPPEIYMNDARKTTPNDEIWWTQFDDPALNRLMDSVFAENLSIEQAMARLDRAHATYIGARSTIFPSLSAKAAIQDGDYIDKDKAALLPPGAGFSISRYEVGLTAAYELDIYGKLSAARGAAKADFLASKEDIKSLVITMSAQTAELYFAIVDLSLQLELTDNISSAYEDNLSIVNGKYARGVSPSLDVYQAQANLASAKARRTQLDSQLSALKHSLALLVGQYPDLATADRYLSMNSKTDDSQQSIVQWISDGGDVPPMLAELNAGLPSDLVQRRPDVRAAYLRVEAADKRWAQAMLNRLPSFSLTGNVGGSNDDLKEAINPENMIWTAIGNLAMPIFQGGRLKASSDAAEASLRESMAGYKAKLLTSFKEVEDALVAGQNQTEYVSEIERQVSSSLNSLKAANDRYLRGLTSYLQVVTAQARYFNARSSLISARTWRRLVKRHG